MSFSDWIAGLFSSKSSEEIEDNENSIERNIIERNISGDIKDSAYNQVYSEKQDESEMTVLIAEEQAAAEAVILHEEEK